MQRWATVAIALAAAACGRVRFADQPDAPAPPDAPVDALLRPCTGPLLFEDDFDVPGEAPLFGIAGSGATPIPVTEVGSELVFDLAGPLTGPTYRGYRTTATYPLDGLCVTVEATQFPAALRSNAFVKIFDTSHVAEVFLYDGGAGVRLSARAHVDAVGGSGTVDQGIEIAFEPTLRFWRLQQIGNRTYWEVSGDGTSFVQLAERDDLFSESAVFIEVGAGSEIDVMNGGRVAYQRTVVRGP